jgi:trans-2,3-dihydro-3-hydroxyanthranilate isomerase
MIMRALPYVQTSVFVDERYAFGGNQLATFWQSVANASISSEEMLGIAREINFSETTFLEEPTESGCAAKVRIFTPIKEIPFAGHPTLGSAYVMQHRDLISNLEKQAVLELGIGPVKVEFHSNDTVSMVQPPAKLLEKIDDVESVLNCIGLDSGSLEEDVPVQIVSTGLPFVIVPLNSLESVRKARPISQLISSRMADYSSQEILVFSTQTEHQGSAVHARMFAPGVGVLEDSATGSAAGPLGAYVEHYSLIPDHEIGAAITIEQGFEMNRPSQILYHHTDHGPSVAGKVRLVAEGHFYV